MLKEKYINCIIEFLNEIEDEKAIKKIYEFAQIFWLRS